MNKRGFTLVEISIVLIIIGILIGGVLKGTAMIGNTKIKRVKSDVDGITAAVYSYQDKYGFLPGDDPTDRSTDLGATSCTGGDGDGLFTDNAESACAWQEMIGAGFVSGNPADHIELTVAKKTPYGGRYTFINGTHGGKSGNYIAITSMPETESEEIDIKYDDGAYDSGDIQTDTDYTTGAVKTMYWYAF